MHCDNCKAGAERATLCASGIENNRKHQASLRGDVFISWRPTVPILYARIYSKYGLQNPDWERYSLPHDANAAWHYLPHHAQRRTRREDNLEDVRDIDYGNISPRDLAYSSWMSNFRNGPLDHANHRPRPYALLTQRFSSVFRICATFFFLPNRAASCVGMSSPEEVAMVLASSRGCATTPTLTHHDLSKEKFTDM